MTLGRYAPSPSGRMHLGNLCCCLLAWLCLLYTSPSPRDRG